MTVADRIAAAFGYVRRPVPVRVYEVNAGPPPTADDICNAVGYALALGEPVGISFRNSGPKNDTLHVDMTFRHKESAA